MSTTNRFAPYEQHGVEIMGRTAEGGGIGNCPWCRDRSGSSKRGMRTFFIRADGEVWDCKTCGRRGNLSVFFLHMFRHNASYAPIKILNGLSVDRGGLEVRTFRSWGVGWNGSRYTYPAWIASERDRVEILAPSDIRLYRTSKRPVSSVGGHAGLIMPVRKGEAEFRNSKRIYVCEGEWDGMAWWEALRSQGIEDDVVAVPGATIFPQKTLGLFKNKEVVFLYDNDEAGQLGCERAWTKLQGIASSMKRIKWKEGLSNGWDVRDAYTKDCGLNGGALYEYVTELLVDEGFSKKNEDGSLASVSSPGGTSSNVINPEGKGLSSEETLTRYRKWLKLDQPEILDIVFGAAFANRMELPPLWIFLVGQSGSGKSEVLMSLSNAPLINDTSSITDKTLISGMDFGKQDPSLIPKLIGKTWVVKDFTTILDLRQEARDAIFSILRDAYDGKVERGFGNGVRSRRYVGKFGIIAGTTGKIDSVANKNAALGERFLRWRIKSGGTVLSGTEIIMKSLKNLHHDVCMKQELLMIAKEVLDRPITRDQYPTLPSWFNNRLVELAQWVSNMRGVIERDRWGAGHDVMLSKPIIELGTRIANQLAILAMGIGVYHGKKEVDEEIYSIIVNVARDTCPDRMESVVRAFYVLRGEATVAEISKETHFNHGTVKAVIDDLMILKAVNSKGAGNYYLSESYSTLLQKLKLYDQDRAWREAESEESGHGKVLARRSRIRPKTLETNWKRPFE